MPGSDILHFGMIRVRVVGNGNLDARLFSLDDVEKGIIVSLTMSNPNARKIDRLCNFISQSARLKLGTDTFEEYFKVNDITIYVKPQWTQYPG